MPVDTPDVRQIEVHHRRLLGLGWMVALFWGMTLLGACADSEPAPSSRPEAPSSSAAGLPNLILVVVDALRADRLGAYGHTGGLSPELDAFAREGVVFDRAIAQAPWTQPSVASIFTGVYPGVHRVLSYRVALEGAHSGEPVAPVLDANFTTLAEALRRGGYQTAAFIANPFVAHKFGFEQGFEHYDGSFAWYTTPGSRVNEAALDWLTRRDSARPFFLYLHYMDVHGPYDAPAEFLDPLLDAVDALPRRRELSAAEYEALDYLKRPPSDPRARERYRRLRSCYEYWVARYEAGVRAFDHHFSSLREELVGRDLWDSAYIVVTSDHGEALLDQGLWDHGFSVGHVEVWVPLLLRWPGRLPAGERVPELVRHIDLMPTLLDQLELAAVEGLQGRSFAWRLTGEEAKLPSNASAAPPTALSEAVKSGPEQKVLYAGNRKLMRVEDEAGGHRDQVYDVSQRDGEDRPVVADGAELERRRLRESLERQLLENAQRSVEVEQRALDDLERQRLEALGYVPGS